MSHFGISCVSVFYRYCLKQGVLAVVRPKDDKNVDSEEVTVTVHGDGRLISAGSRMLELVQELPKSDSHKTCSFRAQVGCSGYKFETSVVLLSCRYTPTTIWHPRKLILKT